MEQLVIEALAVEEVAVLPELLAVVGGHHDERIREAPVLLERVEEPADLLVDGSDRGVVERDDLPAIGVAIASLVGAVGIGEGVADRAGVVGVGEELDVFRRR